MASTQPDFFGRFFIAGVNVLVPLHTGFIVAYFIVTYFIVTYFIGNSLERDHSWLVDALGYALPLFFIPSLFLLPAAVYRRSVILSALATVPMAWFLWTYGALFLPNRSPEPTGLSFTIMAFNVLALNEEVDAVAAEILAHSPDILGLHELKTTMGQVLEEQLGGIYPYRLISPDRGLFSRYPIQSTTIFRMAEDGAWAHQAVVIMGAREVTVLNVHPRSPRLLGTRCLQGILPSGPTFGFPIDLDSGKRDRDVADLLSRLDKAEGPLIVVGDFNLTDRQASYKMLTDRLIDLHLERGWSLGFTRTPFPAIGLATWRIDYVFHSPGMVALGTAIGDFAGSDHRPVIANLGFLRMVD